MRYFGHGDGRVRAIEGDPGLDGLTKKNGWTEFEPPEGFGEDVIWDGKGLAERPAQEKAARAKARAAAAMTIPQLVEWIEALEGRLTALEKKETRA